MAVYNNKRAGAAITRVEFSPGPHGQIGAYHLTSQDAVPELRAWLKTHGQELLSESQLNGKPVLVTQSDRTVEQNIHALSQRGDDFKLQDNFKGVDPWVIRSLLGFGGQGLQLASSFLRPDRKLDSSVFVFAASNLTANAINLIYKAQNLEDVHQLRFLKTQLNDSLTPHLAAGAKPPSINDRRLNLRAAEQEKRSSIDPFNDFMQRHSVKVGELGLRYIGAFGMAFNLDPLTKGKLPVLNANPLRRFAGMGSIFGKTLALTSKVEDPYNPKPPSAFDRFREKYSFMAGGLIEAAAFSALTYDSFYRTGPKSPGFNELPAGKLPHSGISWKKGGKILTDIPGGIGGAMFVAGYLVRTWAKFGERRVNMDELYAHASDTLALAPSEQVPALLSQVTNDIVTHFKNDPHVDYAVVYSKIASDLHAHHHLDLAPEGMVMEHTQVASIAPPKPTMEIAAQTASTQRLGIPQEKPVGLAI